MAWLAGRSADRLTPNHDDDGQAAPPSRTRASIRGGVAHIPRERWKCLFVGT